MIERAKPRAKRIGFSNKNPDHPSLQFKKLGGYDRIWSVRISAQYRAVGERHADTISWAWIGTHNEFDKLFR
jgi:hypothetical protein